MYDVIIIGGGPAGLTAGIYSRIYNLKTLIIEKGMIGGTALTATKITNWPGIMEIGGLELMLDFKKHALDKGVEIKEANVIKVDKNSKKVFLEGEELDAKSIIICVGSKAKALNVKGEKEFFNKGIHYCATCDGAMYQEKEVVVYGSSIRAINEAEHLMHIAKKVTLVSPKDSIEKEVNESVSVIYNTRITAFRGEKFLQNVLLKSVDGEEIELNVSGAFLSNEFEANTGFINVEKKDNKIIVNDLMRTSEEGIFAGGDCINKDLMQIVTATGEGAKAAFSAFKYINKK